ncbi:MAG: STAS domain-containing protein [Nitrospirota bacterium]|nr:STAS domain-containing protein [Nitrospirota bacterium]MDH5699292.1 STAS domain-containing protein [Nitrospirota bacterium]
MDTMYTQPTLIHDSYVITLGTCFDVYAEPALESAVLHVQEVQGKHIILNLEALATLDSRALGKLFLTYHHLNRKQIRLSMVNPRPAVREMLAFVNFPQIVPVYDSIDAVMAFEHRQMDSSSLHQQTK